MQVIKEENDPAFFRFVTDGNLLRQYDFLRSHVEVALRQPGYVVSHDIVRQLNNYAVVQISETPGKYREKPIYIKNSHHVPPEHGKVSSLMDDCLQYIARNWKSHSAVHLAAYSLWRLNWIHPFVEGNGRTARATCYLVLCVKHGLWLPGGNTIPKQIRDDRTPYYAALREADRAHDPRDGRCDVSRLEGYLEMLLTKQLGG